MGMPSVGHNRSSSAETAPAQRSQLASPGRTMGAFERLMSHPLVYWASQAAFAKRKLVPFLRNANLDATAKVLDLGCGPGTNAALFASSRYVGVDSNPAYIEFARNRYAGEFVVGDALTYSSGNRDFDLILLNSFLHHVDDEGVRRLFSGVEALLQDDGFVHLIDMVLPERLSLARTLAKLDRGDFPRALEHWRQLFAEHFEVVHFEPFALRLGGLTFWDAVYIKGRRRQ